MVLIKDFTEHNMEHSNAISYSTNNKLREEGSDGNHPSISSTVPRQHHVRNTDRNHLGTEKEIHHIERNFNHSVFHHKKACFVKNCNWKTNSTVISLPPPLSLFPHKEVDMLSLHATTSLKRIPCCIYMLVDA